MRYDPTGSHDHFSGKPNGDSSKGINPIWDKLDDHEKRITSLEGRVDNLENEVPGSSTLVDDVIQAKKDIDDLKDPSSGYTPPSISGGGSSGGVTWGNSSGGIGPIGGASGTGLIIQYGTLLTIKGNKPLYHLTYPKPFTQDGYSIVGNDVGECGNAIWSIGFEHKTKTGCDILVRLGNCTDGTVLVAWIAIGK